MISETLLNTLNTLIPPSQSPLRLTGAISGGSINSCYQLQSGLKSYFLKVNLESRYPGMFLAEAQGLKLLAGTGTIRIPEVIACGKAGPDQFLLLEWIERGAGSRRAQQDLGEALASMHRHSASAFGLDHDNYMGSLPQSNRQHSTWAEFFVNERLIPQVNIATHSNLLNRMLLNSFDTLYRKLPGLFPEEVSALIHGDLWGGNYMISDEEMPVLIDPAVSYGNREVDIAMTMLFGGFHNDFYSAYNGTFPLNKDWRSRTELWNLYPLLVHLNLFGRSYLRSIEQALKQYL